MPRYILIDHASGYIWADTADLPGFDGSAGTPEDAARAIDARDHTDPALSEWARVGRSDAPDYHVYRADIDGSEAVPVVWDGQDQETIDAVVSSCRYVTSLRRIPVEEWFETEKEACEAQRIHREANR